MESSYAVEESDGQSSFYKQLHPPILSASHEFTTKIVRAFHRVLKHVGTDNQLSFIRQLDSAGPAVGEEDSAEV